MSLLCLLYTRRSTDEQEDSQSVQERFAREWCECEGHTLVEVCHEIPISGSKTVERRPVLAEIRARLKDKNRGFDTLLVWKLDRLFRNPGEQYKWLEILDREKCALYSVTEVVDRITAQGRFVHHLLMGVSALERELTGERIKSHNLHIALSGRWPAGKPPLGLTYDPETKEITANDRAGEAIRVFQEFIRSGGNASATARALNALGMVSRVGFPWRDDSVLTIVKSAVYRQQIQYDGRKIDAPDLIPRIVPEELTRMADSLIGRFNHPDHRATPRVYPYSGIMTCSECGGRMRIQSNLRHYSWVCRAHKEGNCKSRSIADRYVDRLVGMAIHETLSAYRNQIAGYAAEKKPKKVDAISKRVNLEAMKNRIKQLFIGGHIDLAEFTRRTDDIDKQIAKIKPEATPAIVTSKIAGEWLDKLADTWTELTSDDKRELLMIIEAEIVINSGERPLWVELRSNLSESPVRAALKSRHRY